MIELVLKPKSCQMLFIYVGLLTKKIYINVRTFHIILCDFAIFFLYFFFLN